jgi:ubiquinone/menaquinone biosynthesis C-methylase UbiE
MECGGVIREYSKAATIYDSKWSFYVEASTDETIKRLSLKPNARVLDVGCGTGALLKKLAQRRDLMLYGVDPVPEMLAVARRKLPETVSLQQGWAEEIPHAAREFDTVVCCSVFHYIREPAKALLEMRRVLKPGGVLVLTDWCRDFFLGKIYDSYLRAFDSAHFRTYTQAECASLLRHNGFGKIEQEHYKINWFWGLMTLRGNRVETL